jgi:hypothetical protein
MKLTPRQEQIVIGTILGGSSLIRPPKGVNYYLAMRSKNPTWLQYKMAELEDFFPGLESRLYRSQNTYRCYSCCHDEFSRLRKQLYSGKYRRMDFDLIWDKLKLDDTAWTIWFLESGGKTGRGHKNAYLNTTMYGDEGSLAICDYFNRLDAECNVNKNKNRRRIVFSIAGTKELFRVIGQLVPVYMYDRL